MNEYARGWVGNYGYGDAYLILKYRLNSQNQAGGYSNVTRQLVLYLPEWISWTSGYFTINGGGRNNLGTYYGAGEHVLWESTENFYHDSNGYCNVSMSAYIHTTFGIDGSVSGSFSLPRINRLANLTSSANLNLEGKNTKHQLTFSNPGNLWIQLEYIWNGSIGIVKKVGQVSSCTVTFTQEELQKLYKLSNYTLRVVTHSNGNYTNYIGWNDHNGSINRYGIVHITVDGVRKVAVPYYGKNGKWNIACAYFGKDKNWKKGR